MAIFVDIVDKINIHSMKSYEALKKFGLTGKESAVYTAVVALGRANAQSIAKEAGVSRTTTYSVIESLISKNLLFLVQDGKIKHYSAEDPQKIMAISEETTRSLKEIIPELKQLYKSAKGKPKIKHYEGIAEIKEMYNDVLRIKGLKEYLVIASEEGWTTMDSTWIEDYKIRRASAKIKTRLLLENSPTALQRQKDGMKFLSEVRILKELLFTDGKAALYIFHNKVIFVEYKKDYIAVEIQSSGIAQLLKIVFESLWKTTPE